MNAASMAYSYHEIFILTSDQTTMKSTSNMSELGVIMPTKAKCLKPSVGLPRHDIPGTLAIGTVRKRQPTTATAPNAQVKRTGPSMASKVGGLLQNFKPLALSP